jgi:hypothetical protein
MKEKIQSFLGEIPTASVTALKTSYILGKSMKITGFVLTGENGEISIVDKNVVRWLSKEEMRKLMHENKI